MRLATSLLLAFLAATPPTYAQTPAEPPGWHLGVGVEAVRFGWAARTPAAPGVAAELRPSGRPALALSIGRAVGRWSLELDLGWAGGHVEASNDAVSIQDKSSDVTRYRLAAGLGRRVAELGSGQVIVALVPTIDLWAVDGDSRSRAGVEGRLLLRVPLGGVELENRLGLGISGSPIEAADIGEVSDQRGLRSVSVGVGLRLRV